MRTRFGTSLVVTVVLAVGAVAGWLAAQLGKCENVEVCKYGNMDATGMRRGETPETVVILARKLRDLAI